MIIGANREKVIKNIAAAANKRDFSAKTEVGDPVMSLEERQKLVANFWRQHNKLTAKLNYGLGHLLFSFLAKTITASTEIVGLENLTGLPIGGAIITSNHYNQLDALPIKLLANKKHQQLSIVIEDTNLMLPGFLRYLMTNVGTIPLLNTPNYIGNDFLIHLHDALARNNWVLIYPEQEMWWNYRKPRKGHRGAYYFAAKQNVPIISTFTEIKVLPQLEKKDHNFYRTKYIVHVLPIIYPELRQSVKENSYQMMQKDYQQKVTAYEKIYHKKLNYDFSSWDIAGWRK